MQQSPHSFHIPVMGLSFTIDTPIKVARFGINSVISIVQDNLIEKMRAHYYNQLQEPFEPIATTEVDYRSKRITDYLNLVQRIVNKQVEALKLEAFETDSELDRYFELLPEGSELKRAYQTMVVLPANEEKAMLANWLRSQVVPGSIDVNIMTKLDREQKDKEGAIVPDGSDAVAALRGYINSTLHNSSIVLSAGMNPRLFAYMEKCGVFDATDHNQFQKKIILKVSDYRSALVQGKMLTKRGLWVNEFRIESGLNCGGHAFATDGFLAGPILQEFKDKRNELLTDLQTAYQQAREAKGMFSPQVGLHFNITYQGGIGTAEEDKFLRDYYELSGTGWGTPFLLVPEATTVDEETLGQLCKATEKDVVLSKSSPLGTRFYNLLTSSAQQEKARRIKKGKPGSPCTEKFLQFNTEFTEEAICTASRQYQKFKLAALSTQGLEPAVYEQQVKDVLAKECLCIGLSNSVVNEYQLTPFKNLPAISICPGPGIAYFSKIVSLKTMIDHIYGRTTLIDEAARPHVFIKELRLYIEYWTELTLENLTDLDSKKKKYIASFYENILRGIHYYEWLMLKFNDDAIPTIDRLTLELQHAQQTLIDLFERFQKRTNSIGA